MLSRYSGNKATAGNCNIAIDERRLKANAEDRATLIVPRSSDSHPDSDVLRSTNVNVFESISMPLTRCIPRC